MSIDGEGEENTGIRQRLCSAKEQAERTPLQLPLREPPVQDACGHYVASAPCSLLLFSSTDIVNWQRRRILTEVRKWLKEMAPEGTANPQRWAELATPDERPNWDCNTEEGSGHLERYWAAILQGLKRGPRKPMSMAKLSKVIQRESESPSEFYERLCEACRLYTPIDPEAAGSQMVINAEFVSLDYLKNVRWGDTK